MEAKSKPLHKTSDLLLFAEYLKAKAVGHGDQGFLSAKEVEKMEIQALLQSQRSSEDRMLNGVEERLCDILLQ